MPEGRRHWRKTVGVDACLPAGMAEDGWSGWFGRFAYTPSAVDHPYVGTRLQPQVAQRLELSFAANEAAIK